MVRGSKGIRNGDFEFRLFFNHRNNVLLKTESFFNCRYVFFIWPSEYLTKKHPAPTKRATIILIKVKLRNTLLRMVLLYIPSYLKSAMTYKF